MHVGGDLRRSINRQCGFRAGRGRAGRGHLADLRAAVGDVAEPVQPTSIRPIQDDDEMPFRLDKLS